MATCNIEPPGQMGQSEALVDRADVGYAISGVDDNAWKSLNMSHLYLSTALPARLNKSGRRKGKKVTVLNSGRTNL